MSKNNYAITNHPQLKVLSLAHGRVLGPQRACNQVSTSFLKPPYGTPVIRSFFQHVQSKAKNKPKTNKQKL